MVAFTFTLCKTTNRVMYSFSYNYAISNNDLFVMQILLAISAVVAVALARPEPPVGNQYLPPGLQTEAAFGGPSSQYGAPSSQFGAPSSQYGAPSGGFGGGRPSSSYGAPRPSRPSSQYGAPSSQFGAPSSQYGAPGGGYGGGRGGYDEGPSVSFLRFNCNRRELYF